jgi:hypothetical protein
LRGDLLEIPCLLVIGASVKNPLNERVQGVGRQVVDSKEFADSMVGNAAATPNWS